jgi:aryl-alcohol dehydrogenase-like predicted oxidoreductase
VSQRPGVTAPIVGASTYEQLEINFGAVGWSLTDDEMDRLTAVSEIRSPYPYDDMISVAQRDR